MESSYQQQAKVFKALCDENRLRILELLRSGERCACELLEELHIGQSTLSHHMRILCDSGIVVGRKEGKWVYYRIDPAGSAAVAALLARLTAARGDARRGTCGTEEQ
nr:metalloregulator ArsR/SmtB family transcription factor [uncultured Oscillibacter sp.]